MYVQMGRDYRYLGGTQLEAEDRVRLSDQQLWLSERQGAVASVRSTEALLNLTDVIGLAADQMFAEASKRAATRRVWREMSACTPVQRSHPPQQMRHAGNGKRTASRRPSSSLVTPRLKTCIQLAVASP